MGQARQIVSRFIEMQRSLSFDAFAPASLEQLVQRPGVAPILRALEQEYPGRANDVLLLCMQALSVHHSELFGRILDAEFVATLPEGARTPARRTRDVIHEMLRGPHDEVVALGYEVSDGDVVEALQDVAGRGARIVLVCDRVKGTGLQVLRNWPAGPSPPRVYQDRVRPDALPYASMHGKALLVDGKDLLVTSANFTHHGMHGNIEFGVRLRGAAARQAREVFRHILASDVVELVELEL